MGIFLMSDVVGTSIINSLVRPRTTLIVFSGQWQDKLIQKAMDVTDPVLHRMACPSLEVRECFKP